MRALVPFLLSHILRRTCSLLRFWQREYSDSRPRTDGNQNVRSRRQLAELRRPSVDVASNAGEHDVGVLICRHPDFLADVDAESPRRLAKHEHGAFNLDDVPTKGSTFNRQEESCRTATLGGNRGITCDHARPQVRQL